MDIAYAQYLPRHVFRVIAMTLIIIINIIFIIRAYTYLSRQKSIHKTTALMGEEADGSLSNDFINVIRGSKYIIIANLVYFPIKLINYTQNIYPVLIFASIIISSFVMWNEYSSN